ncbi:carbon catabolite repressor protein 4-like 1-like [Quillaja saponaria]|uniref:Carbon catabolite repressor protein 4-like 1-like n=1 Tax=Quillaja saponaria TaxID=32244 RepID=A0AAD7LJG6_QUISA|nr:carbon catabolite repressor protein 4-like 1-like [Quillaja saponaria]
MDVQENESLKFRVKVTLRSTTPVVGIEINPGVSVSEGGSFTVRPYFCVFSWYREQITCYIHHTKFPTLQCMSCVELNVPVKESYYCSRECFIDSWAEHKKRHLNATETISRTSTDHDQQKGRKLRSCGSWRESGMLSWPEFGAGSWPEFGTSPWPEFGTWSLLHESEVLVEREGKIWFKVGSSKNYVPKVYDTGLRLRLECVAVDCSRGILSSPVNVTVTDPVIEFPAPPRPRSVVPIGCLQKSCNFHPQSSNYITFSILSYNILSDLYTIGKYDYCPSWALVWEYRCQNLLREIIKYNADILCLQEVQSNHFEIFFEPELKKCGYLALYKKRSNEVYTANQYTTDGCATFYRHDRFREITKYELEFDKMASSVVEALEPELRTEGSIRLKKDNVALIVMLETLANGCACDASQSRVCVANTHIHSSPELPYVKLYQVATLLDELEKIVQSQVPLIVCGDFNSHPQSDPHTFIVNGKLDPGKKSTDPYGIHQHLKLRHPLSLMQLRTDNYWGK